MYKKLEPLPTSPADQDRLMDLPAEAYDFNRPLYRCLMCEEQGENSSHKYVDECPFFEG